MRNRLVKYKALATAFSYPDGVFFRFFPQLMAKKEQMLSDYDNLFRAGEVWLYGAEYLAENEFQRADALADINGFYKGWGLEPAQERPDALPAELEFMHYLIFKQINAPAGEKARICRDSQRKFFSRHLYPAAKKISEKIVRRRNNDFYHKAAGELLEFLESEKTFLKGGRG